jgi:hypothetical protein
MNVDIFVDVNIMNHIPLNVILGKIYVTFQDASLGPAKIPSKRHIRQRGLHHLCDSIGLVTYKLVWGWILFQE